MFEPFLLDFFVNSTDAAFIRKLKLGILTCIASETNIGTILEELNVRLVFPLLPPSCPS
jgi:Holliday junction resolvasome RuvABC ATP-dependent DNA helicase subunit